MDASVPISESARREARRGSLHGECHASEESAQQRSPGAGSVAREPVPWSLEEGSSNVRAGNPAVLGSARRPEALRPHLSVSLPLKRGLLCIAARTSASSLVSNL